MVMVLWVEKGEEVIKSDDALISKVLSWKLLGKIVGTITNPNNDNWDCLKLEPSTSRYKAAILPPSCPIHCSLNKHFNLKQSCSLLFKFVFFQDILLMKLKTLHKECAEFLE
jgi:hypothetical protein